MSGQPFPNPKRYITANDDNGESFFSQAESESLAIVQDLGSAKTRLAYTTVRPPVTLANSSDLTMYAAGLRDLPPLVPVGGGANVWYIDTPPLSESPMHRTISLDFVIQVRGEVELIMSNGETRLVKPGDITIQRSTLHKWRNPSTTEWTRMVGIMAECEPVVLPNGNELQSVFPKH